MLIRKLKINAVILILASCLLVSETNAASVSVFSDVPTSKSYAHAVYELAERNVIGGYEDGTFKPGASITRGQAASIIAKLVKLDTTKVKDPGFKDVSPSQWNYGAIAALANAGIINGYGDGRFGPNDTITRAQMASILVKAFELPPYYYNNDENPFDDIRRLGSHQVNIHILHKMGITSGTSANAYSPNAPITRAQAAVLIVKTEKVKASIVTLQASDFGWDSIYSYEDYQSRNDIIHSVHGKGMTFNEIHMVPVREGTATFFMVGSKRDPITGEDSHEDYRKYYVHVKQVDDQLKLDFEETDDILATEVRLFVENDPIESISLAKRDGELIQADLAYSLCNPGPYPAVCFSIKEPGEFVATIHYASGQQVRYAVTSEIYKPSFRYHILTLEERQGLTIQVGDQPNQIGAHRLPEGSEKIADIQREKNTDVFHIKGLAEGEVYIQFPDSKNDIIGLHVQVRQLGDILQVNATIEWNPNLYY
ncbi:S-layer homology domain-containing protein [Sporosarcina sp. ACRSM]|uniref:S-layer homology domain-containing protein n=1 Tax=Sporosarcina sp. ACRSM TaxID=2918216 RepID=UPI001EF590FD|nr:S-layer homology domain-containing protein [Sporosarcina sp. ACRSM]MCG7337022.1 S-layer homology domain-containing protein [Sporosarcina sp. ACRSM]